MLTDLADDADGGLADAPHPAHPAASRDSWNSRREKMGLREVVAGPEVLVVGGDHQPAGVVVAIEVVEHEVELVAQRPAQGVAALGPVERQGRDAAVLRVS
ncbi:MAG: hypothetical protein L0H59_17760 [Tomitella sp.]|nr:hypothetical protein [Tomitella sp.]